MRRTIHVKLYLRNNNLTGRIPASIGNLTSLVELHLSYNILEGQVPDPVTSLIHLKQLGFSVNSLSGEFPSSLFNLSSLELISLSYNNFSGNLRPDLGNFFPNLQRLYLAQNSFTGSIPSSLANASKLLQLDFPENNFTGSIPVSFGNLEHLFWLNIWSNHLGYGEFDDLKFLDSLANCSNLEYLLIGVNQFGDIGNWSHLIALDFSFNNFSGIIPPTIGNCLSLGDFHMQGNSLHGTIPDIGALMDLQFLDLSLNNLSGPIPHFMENLTSLQYLNLSFNDLEGQVPVTGPFSNVNVLVISGNPKLCGGIQDLHLHPCVAQEPKKMQSNLTTLQELHLSYCNNIAGQIPDSISPLKKLREIGVGVNRLPGEFPASLSDIANMFPNLQRLHLAQNHFTGSIPSSLANATKMMQLDIPQNNFTGTVPICFSDQVNLLWPNVLGKSLENGAPDDLNFIDHLTNCSNLQFLHIGLNQFGGTLPNSIVNLSVWRHSSQLHSEPV
ncbi:hypothetical protein RND71_017901 [Anisodus tanguticus]|uniref:Uncharacterized protein n=1 Tax=Anisodus tanguticus TaxID=243964 RepID=A0AAE1S3B5_9SOLA|nr:hypothetical protein RND71_017901 [Anisodus tanguticus]